MIDIDGIKLEGAISAIRDRIWSRCLGISDSAGVMGSRMRFEPYTPIQVNIQSIKTYIAEIEELNAELKRLEVEQ